MKLHPNGDIFIWEVCRKYHGKRTVFYEDGSINNRVFRNGSLIADKEVQAHEAFYTKEGKIQTADRADWKSFTALEDGEEW